MSPFPVLVFVLLLLLLVVPLTLGPRTPGRQGQH